MTPTHVVTGGTGGIGMYTAIGLARSGARVLVTGRNAERGEAAVAHIRDKAGVAPDRVRLVRGDVSSREGIGALADALLDVTDRIDVLVNNAGCLAQSRTVNADGYELDFAVNVVAPYLLTHRLKPALAAAAPSRVLNVTGGKAAGPFDPTDLQAETGFVPLIHYTKTKRAMEAMTQVLAKELAGDDIGVHVVYPGRASTAMTQAMTPASLPWFMRPAWPLFRILIPKDDGGASAQRASASSVYAAGAAALDGRSCAYVDTHSKLAKLHPSVMDGKNQAAVMAAIRQR